VNCGGKTGHHGTKRDPPQGSAIKTADLPVQAPAEAGKRHRTCAATQVSSVHGFVLLEVLVAFVIAALALVVLYNAGLTGLRSTAAATHYEQAVARARSRLTMAEHASPLMAGNWDGDDGGGYFWHLRVTPMASATVQPSAALTLTGSASVPLTLYAISVSITWHDADATRVVRLDTEEIGQGIR
jgi:general secretion pathway protein I